MADDLLTRTRSLEEEVGAAAERVRLPGQSDERLTQALVDAVLEIAAEQSLTLAGLDSDELLAELAAAIYEAFAGWSGETKRSMLTAVQDVVGLAERFYEGQGLDTTGLREAAQRSQAARIVTESLDAGLNQIQEQLRTGTVDAIREQILSGQIDRTALAAEIERRAKTSSGYARIQAHAAVGGYNQAYRETVAQRAGLSHYHYFGPVQNNTRPFCRIHVGYVFPRRRIDQMRNGMLEPVLTYKGGYNCRHALLPVDPAWDTALAARVVDVDPTEIATTLSGGGLITVIAPAARVDRLKSQIPLESKSYLRFHDAETNDTGYVAINERWHVARLNTRAGSKARALFDNEVEHAIGRAELGERVLLTGAPPRQTFTHDEHAAVVAYTDTDYIDLNRRLRERSALTAPQRRLAQNLDSALAKLPIHVGPVERGYGFGSASNLADHATLFTPGDLVAMPSYVSTSLEASVADTFASQHAYRVRLSIKSKTGRYIGQFSVYASEDEVLIPRDSLYRVLNRALSKNELRIDLEEL